MPMYYFAPIKAKVHHGPRRFFQVPVDGTPIPGRKSCSIKGWDSRLCFVLQLKRRGAACGKAVVNSCSFFRRARAKTDGPNPERAHSESNVGNVWVEAWYQSAPNRPPMGARAFMLLMPPKFVFNPIN